jgi:hypothetical protein
VFYKFLDTTYIDSVLRDGTIKLSTLQHFRELEKGNPWIGDRLEGATELTTPDQFTLTEGSPELEAINRANIFGGMFPNGFADIEGSGKIEMGGARFIHHVPNLYIYSYSSGDLDELKQTMCVDARVRYDACMRIHDPRGLMETIASTTAKAGGNFIFKSGTTGTVTYAQVTRDVTAGPAIAPSPFTKAPLFAPQRECRFVFDPAVGLPDSIIITIPNPEKYFKEVFRGLKP